MEWISVEDIKKPLELKQILVTDGKEVTTGYFGRNGDETYFLAEGYYNFVIKGDVTHWMELPEPPKEVK